MWAAQRRGAVDLLGTIRPIGCQVACGRGWALSEGGGVGVVGMKARGREARALD